MNNDLLIVSVESRKGGVGKTTAALNLARILLEKNKYAVLFLDVDITGTNVTDGIDSPYWKDVCHAVKNNTDNANLLEIFDQKFMSGLDIPTFSIDKTSTKNDDEITLIFKPDKINIIGSQIFHHRNNSEENNKKYTCKPSILFDELHAFWLIEFLQEICEDFRQVIINNQPEKSVAIIIDNSPGYVGIAPAIQEWLTDLGPEIGKFLIVSSLDKQDLLSCNSAIDNLRHIYTQKWSVSQEYATAIKDNAISVEEIHLSHEKEKFFLRFITEYPKGKRPYNNHGLNGINYKYYSLDNKEIGNIYNNINKYIGLLINKAPRDVKRGVYDIVDKKLHFALKKIGNLFLNHHTENYKNTYYDLMVSYDEYIEFQFLSSIIVRREGRISQRKKHFENAFEYFLKKRYTVPQEEILQHLTINNRMLDSKMLNEFRLTLKKIDTSVISTMNFLDQNGFYHLTKLIHKEWLPDSILRDFRTELQNSLLESGSPIIELEPWEFRDESVDPDYWQFIEHTFNYTLQKMIHQTSQNHREYLYQLLPSLTVVMSFAINSHWHESKVGDDMLTLFENFAIIEADHWDRRRGQSKERLSIQRFLATEKIDDEDLLNFINKTQNKPHLINPENLPRLYNLCAYAQARLIDVQRDATFIIELIHRLVREDIKKALVLPDIKSVAEKVIVRKSMSHKFGYRKIEEGFMSANYMEEFSEVLENILRKWEIM